MKDSGEITEVREAHRIDEAALARYLAQHVEGYAGDLRVRQFEGGQSNPTYLLEAGSARYVMRKKPPGQLLKSAHQVDREYRVMRALAETDVPVPRMHTICEDTDVVGTAFYVMEWVEGRVISDARLPDMTPSERTSVYEDFIRVLAELHSIDPVAIGLESFGRPGNYYGRQISRWSQQYEASKTGPIPAMEALMNWLPENVPASDETGIVHGDYRIGNCILHPSEPRIVAVLDWELSTLGHPLGDLAYFCQAWRVELGTGASLDRVDLAALGIPTEEAVVARYCELSGRPPIQNWNFYMVFVMFRSAAIMQGVYKRGIDGNASSDRAKRYGEIARACAERAWAMVES